MANTEEFEVNNETLMNCVQQYRVIYDKRCKDYKVPLKKRNAWKEISEKLGIETTEAQKRYNNIRTMFSKYVKRLRSVRSGSGRNDVPQLREDLEYLRWLVTHIRHRPSTTNFKRRTTEEVVQAMMSEPSELTDNESAGEDEETLIDVDDTEDGSVDKGNKKQEESAIEITSGEVDQAGPRCHVMKTNERTKLMLQTKLIADKTITVAFIEHGNNCKDSID